MRNDSVRASSTRLTGRPVTVAMCCMVSAKWSAPWLRSTYKAVAKLLPRRASARLSCMRSRTGPLFLGVVCVLVVFSCGVFSLLVVCFWLLVLLVVFFFLFFVLCCFVF